MPKLPSCLAAGFVLLLSIAASGVRASEESTRQVQESGQQSAQYMQSLQNAQFDEGEVTADTIDDNQGCFRDKREFIPGVHKRKYRVGVHSIRGLDVTDMYYNLTLNSYLTYTVGQRFTEPIEFEMVPLLFNDFMEAVEHEDIDFIYANPGSYSCVGTEFGAHPLATTISKVYANGESYDLDVFGGVIFTRADNDEINTLLDLKDKIIGAGSINVIMGGQAQLYTMMQAGMDYIMDPKKVAFTSDQFAVVDGVLNGTFDAGMIRTDLIERYVNADGVAIEAQFFKVLDPKIHVQDNGELVRMISIYFCCVLDTQHNWMITKSTSYSPTKPILPLPSCSSHSYIAQTFIPNGHLRRFAMCPPRYPPRYRPL